MCWLLSIYGMIHEMIPIDCILHCLSQLDSHYHWGHLVYIHYNYNLQLCQSSNCFQKFFTDVEHHKSKLYLSCCSNFIRACNNCQISRVMNFMQKNNQQKSGIHWGKPASGFFKKPVTVVSQIEASSFWVSVANVTKSPEEQGSVVSRFTKSQKTQILF